jgi:hypothetical protein
MLAHCRLQPLTLLLPSAFGHQSNNWMVCTSFYPVWYMSLNTTFLTVISQVAIFTRTKDTFSVLSHPVQPLMLPSPSSSVSVIREWYIQIVIVFNICDWTKLFNFVSQVPVFILWNVFTMNDPSSINLLMLYNVCDIQIVFLCSFSNIWYQIIPQIPTKPILQ